MQQPRHINSSEAESEEILKKIHTTHNNKVLQVLLPYVKDLKAGRAFWHSENKSWKARCQFAGRTECTDEQKQRIHLRKTTESLHTTGLYWKQQISMLSTVRAYGSACNLTNYPMQHCSQISVMCLRPFACLIDWSSCTFFIAYTSILPNARGAGRSDHCKEKSGIEYVYWHFVQALWERIHHSPTPIPFAPLPKMSISQN